MHFSIFCQRSIRWWWPTQLMMKNSCIQTQHSHALRRQKSSRNWKALHNFTFFHFPFALNSFCHICGCCHTHSWRDMSYQCFYSITFKGWVANFIANIYWDLCVLEALKARLWTHQVLKVRLWKSWFLICSIFEEQNFKSWQAFRPSAYSFHAFGFVFMFSFF